jgi:cell division transport system permease protein
MAMVRRLDYYFRETFQGLRRNGLVAFAAVSTAFIALFLLGMALLVRREADLLIKYTQADVEVSVFLRDDVSQGQQEYLGTLLADMPEISTVEFESKDEAIVRFREIFKDQEDLVANVSDDALPASFRVKLHDSRQFGVVRARIDGQPGIDKVVDHSDVLTKLNAVTAVFRVGVLAVALVMLVSSAVLIGNTVRMAVFARRKEIGIMRLVGATNWHIRVPFLIEGIIEGLLGAGAAILTLFIIKTAFLDTLRTEIQFLPWVGTADVVASVPWLVIASVAVSAIASLFAMRRFLEV